MNYRALAAVILGTAIGLPAGIGCYTFVYAKGYSYMTNDPAACANCHIMQGHYDAWMKSSHRNVATCNDCHLPASFIGKYMTKGSNGYHHSMAFTTGDFHEPIQIKPGNARVTEDTCRKCHQEIVDAVEGTYPKEDTKRISCVRCHDSVGHMR